MLGGFQVEVAGRRIERFRTHKCALLLAYLLRYPQPHPREHLLKLFWAGLPKESAQNNLRVALSYIRRLLEPPNTPIGSVLYTDTRRVGLNPQRVETDVGAFEGALWNANNAESESERRYWLEQAYHLYRGEFLSGFEEPWVVAERERLNGLYQQLLAQIQPTPAKGVALSMPRFAPPQGVAGLGVVLGVEGEEPLEPKLPWIRQVVSVCQGHLVAVYPTGIRAVFISLENALKALDALHGQLGGCRFALDVGELKSHHGSYGGVPMEAVNGLLQAGYPAQILGTERLVVLLASARTRHNYRGRHLGCYRLSVHLSNEQVYQLDLAGRERVFMPLRALPALRKALIEVPTPFIGREAELSQIQALLGEGDGSRLITVIGAPGVGKSRLALECAWRMSALFGEARWWISVHDAQESLGERLARLLSWEWRGFQPFGEAFAEFLHHQPALLVVDFATRPSPEQSAELQSLLCFCPSFRCLSTSLTALGIEQEHCFALQPLSVPPAGASAPAEILQYEAVQLFLDRARRVAPPFRITEQNSEAVAEICRLLDGLPLAIELAAVRVGRMSLSELRERLAVSPEWLGGHSVGSLKSSLLASLRTALHLLSPKAQAIFARLACFPDGWTLESAQAITSNLTPEPKGSENGDSELACALHELKALSLIQQEGERYRMLTPIRMFAKELLAPEEVHALYLRYIDHLSNSAPEVQDLRHRWHALEEERTNIETVLEWAVSHHPESALRLARACSPFWERRGCGGRVYRLLLSLIDRLTEPLQQLQAVRFALVQAIRRGETEDTERLLGEFLPLAERVPTTLESARLWGVACHYAWLQGDYERGLCWIERALAEPCVQESPHDLMEMLLHRGVVQWLQGSLHLALDTFQKVFALTDTPQALPQRLVALSNLCNVLYQLGQREEAFAHLLEAVPLAEQLGDQRTLAILLNSWGVWLQEAGDYAQARERFLQAHALWRELHDYTGEVAALANLAQVAKEEGDTETAYALFQRALEMAEQYKQGWCIEELRNRFESLASAEGVSE